MSAGRRRDAESFRKYRFRLNEEERSWRLRRLGHLIWDSSRKGTYRRAVHGLLGAVLATASSAVGAIPAFPGAQGGGAISVGGRGGAVIEVNNLSDSGSGSLRACVEASGPRTCIFRVGGTINLTKTLTIRNPFLTIAGQSAPGGGIALSGKAHGQHLILFPAGMHDGIIRYIRVRKGFNSGCSSQCGTVVRMAKDTFNMITDHVSATWSQDEILDSSGTNNVTHGFNIVGEPVGSNTSPHPTSHSFLGGPPSESVTMTDLDVHHTLLMNTSHRNPLLRNKSTRMVNNLFYNLKVYGILASGGVVLDAIGNKWKAGPINPNPNWHEVSAFSGYSHLSSPGTPSIYMIGNVGWNQTNPNGDQQALANEVNSENPGFAEQGPLPSSWRRTSPMANTAHPIIAEPVSDKASILAIVGASRMLDCNGNWVMSRAGEPIRDDVDARMVNQYINNTGTSVLHRNESNYGGYPTIANGTPCQDTDRDGMPDAWEFARGLNPNNAADRNGVGSGGFTNLELYLAGPTSGGQVSIPPSVNITAPADAATVSGSSVTVSASASDDVAVLGVQFKLDGVNLGAEDTTSPYSVTWNTTTAARGLIR